MSEYSKFTEKLGKKIVELKGTWKIDQRIDGRLHVKKMNEKTKNIIDISAETKDYQDAKMIKVLHCLGLALVDAQIDMYDNLIGCGIR